MQHVKDNSGVITTLAVVYGGVFLLLLGGLIGFLLLQHQNSLQKASSQVALEIAEAGLNYYRWHLAHDPSDLKDGTGSAGPYVHTYNDPEGGAIGQFSLDISGNMQCGVTSGITITSTGWTNEYPNIKRKISVKYVQPTVADYSFLINDNVWVGSDHQIQGPYQANGGIRMDGTNNSLVTSAQSTWTCTASFGCSPATTQPGVFGAGGNSNLWRYPVTAFDFTGITVNLAQLKSLAQTGGGLYFAPSGSKGYHIILKNNGSMDVYKVTGSTAVNEYNNAQGWHNESEIISTETLLGNYTASSSCGVAFFEDTLWAGSLNTESKVKGKMTVVSADLTAPIQETNVWLSGNITYTSTSSTSTDAFSLVAQHDNLIALRSPDNMYLNGVYIAQTGRFGRNHYDSSQSPYDKRSYLEIFGTVVSNGRVGTKWINGGGSWISGYNNRTTIFDPDLSLDPPPFLPATSEEHDVKEWGEVK